MPQHFPQLARSEKEGILKNTSTRSATTWVGRAGEPNKGIRFSKFVKFLSFFIKRSLLYREPNFAQPVASPFCLRMLVQRTTKKITAFWENPEKFWSKFNKFQQNAGKFATFCKKSEKNSAILNEKFEIRERCKGVHCVDLGESFPTSIYLRNVASIQPRTSPVKFAHSSCTDLSGAR